MRCTVKGQEGVLGAEINGINTELNSSCSTWGKKTEESQPTTGDIMGPGLVQELHMHVSFAFEPLICVFIEILPKYTGIVLL